MVKREPQNLKGLFDFFGEEHFPSIFSEITPYHRGAYFLFPYYGRDDSKAMLALKMIAFHGLNKKSSTANLVEKFSKLKRRERRFLAYEMSHELKIATLAACIALNKQDGNAYEIGPCFGFSSLHYSRIIKEKNLQLKSINKLTSIEKYKEYYEHANDIKKMTGDFVGDIEYIYGDGISYLRPLLKKGDILFSITTEPDVASGIIKLSDLKPINFIVSYSERANERIKELHNKKFEDLIDSTCYDIFPFEDKEYNSHVPWLTKKKGVLARVPT